MLTGCSKQQQKTMSVFCCCFFLLFFVVVVCLLLFFVCVCVFFVFFFVVVFCFPSYFSQYSLVLLFFVCFTSIKFQADLQPSYSEVDFFLSRTHFLRVCLGNLNLFELKMEVLKIISKGVWGTDPGLGNRPPPPQPPPPQKPKSYAILAVLRSFLKLRACSLAPFQ